MRNTAQLKSPRRIKRRAALLAVSELCLVAGSVVVFFVFLMVLIRVYFPQGTSLGENQVWSLNATAERDIDLEFGWNVSDSLRLVLGGSNITDEFVDVIPSQKLPGTAAPVPDEWANRIGVGLPYPRRTAANYEGGSWYLKGILTF